MLRFFLLVFLYVRLSIAVAQVQPDSMSQIMRDRINTTNLTITNNSNLNLFTIKGPAGRLLGDPYLDTNWQAGNVKFYNRLVTSASSDSVAGVPVRLDLSTDEVELKASATDIKVIKVAKGPSVRFFELNKPAGPASRYVNVREYRGEAVPATGFFEQLVKGKLELLLYPSVYIRRADYNVALNSGTKDDEFIKRVAWYVASNQQVTKFTPGKKAMLELMADKKDLMEAYVKQEKSDWKSRKGLAAIVTYYNSL